MAQLILRMEWDLCLGGDELAMVIAALGRNLPPRAMQSAAELGDGLAAQRVEATCEVAEDDTDYPEITMAAQGHRSALSVRPIWEMTVNSDELRLILRALSGGLRKEDYADAAHLSAWISENRGKTLALVAKTNESLARNLTTKLAGRRSGA